MLPIAIGAIGSIVSTVGQIIDNVHTSDAERMSAELEGRKIGVEEMKVEASLLAAQAQINVEEAKHSSIFVAGWRPAVGWTGVAGLFYQFVLYPFMTWAWALMQARGWVPAELSPPPLIDVEALMVLLVGILGIGAARTVEKVKGVAGK